jgi:uncharacterized protein DUF3574
MVSRTSFDFLPAGRALGVGLALLVGGLATGAGSALVGLPVGHAAPAGGDGCDDVTLGVDAAPWARTELYFGSAKPDGSVVGDAEWSRFLDAEITPRFPDGLTVVSGLGQYRGEDGAIVQEQSHLVILFYPEEAATESGAKVEAIRAAYERAFQQESVLRADEGEPAPSCVSF